MTSTEVRLLSSTEVRTTELRFGVTTELRRRYVDRGAFVIVDGGVDDGGASLMATEVRRLLY